MELTKNEQQSFNSDDLFWLLVIEPLISPKRYK